MERFYTELKIRLSTATLASYNDNQNLTCYMMSKWHIEMTKEKVESQRLNVQEKSGDEFLKGNFYLVLFDLILFFIY